MKVSPILRCLAFLFAALSLPLHAADLCYEYTTGDGWHSTREGACFSYKTVKASQPPWFYERTGFTVTGSTCGWVEYEVRDGTQRYGPYNKSMPITSRSVACSQSPQPIKCEPGPKGAINITVGYHATPSTNGALNPLVKVDPFWKQLLKDRAATMCYEGCKVGIGLPDAGADWYVSNVAGKNGLYRSSAELDIQGTSQNCTEASPDAVTPTSTPPACDGALGTVKLSSVCLPSTVESGIDLSGLGEAIRGNPTAGKVDPSKTTAQKAAGSGGTGNGSSPTGADGGGPTGGPATGANNGSTGKGCNDGSKSPTPACSGKGDLDADGNTDKPGDGKEQAACGAPGQPKCRMDETGTPGSVGDDKYLSKLDPYKSESDAAREQIKSVGTGIFEPWAMLFSAPPLATCEGFDLPSRDGQSMGTIDPCNVVDGIRAAMAYIWAIAAFWLCLGWVKSANQ